MINTIQTCRANTLESPGGICGDVPANLSKIVSTPPWRTGAASDEDGGRDACRTSMGNHTMHGPNGSLVRRHL